MKRSEAGYTLLEMMIALAIVGMLTTLAVTNYSEQIPHQQLRDTSANLVAQLRLARQKAISRGTKETILFRPDVRQYDNSFLGVQTLPSHVRFGSSSNVKKAPNKDSKIPMDGISFIGDSATFGSDGTSEMGTIYLTNSKNESVAIAVNITGRIRKYLWNGHDWE